MITIKYSTHAHTVIVIVLLKYFLLSPLQTYGLLYLQEGLPNLFQTLKGIEIALTPLGCTDMLIYASLHLARPTALPALNLV